MEINNHWDEVYGTKSIDTVSWYQEHANRSVELILATKVNKTAPIIDVGSGSSRLIDDLIELGFSNITALDLSSAALDSTKARLGDKAFHVNFMVADITQIKLPQLTYDVWHDTGRIPLSYTAETKARLCRESTKLIETRRASHYCHFRGRWPNQVQWFTCTEIHT